MILQQQQQPTVDADAQLEPAWRCWLFCVGLFGLASVEVPTVLNQL